MRLTLDSLCLIISCFFGYCQCLVLAKQERRFVTFHMSLMNRPFTSCQRKIQERHPLSCLTSSDVLLIVSFSSRKLSLLFSGMLLIWNWWRWHWCISHMLLSRHLVLIHLKARMECCLPWQECLCVFVSSSSFPGLFIINIFLFCLLRVRDDPCDDEDD